MPEVKFDQIVSFSSEDSSQKADNLLANKKWRCQNAGESQATVVIQLSKTAQISSIDIGNNGSAFIEVQVGRKASNEDFKVILVASSFLTPIESRNETNLARVRMFTSEKLNGDIAKDKWDQIKVICSQPFNKSTKYGLSFITVHAIGEDKKKVNTNNSTALGAFRLKDEDDDTIGSLFTGRNSLKKEKESVATSLRSEATLASMAVCTEEASRKRKALDESRQFYQLKKPAAENEASSAKKQKISTTPNVQSEKKLPRRDIIAPGESPLAATSTTPKATPKEKKIRIKESTPVASSSPALASKIKKLPQKKSKPFNELMENVHFCISGFQNPLRGDIRQKALEMGARYKGDWDSSSTHLICAFVNTPKFNQVKAGKGKIVKKDWIERCFEDKKLYPWRRFCLDKNDKGDESEEEIWDESLIVQAASSGPSSVIIDPGPKKEVKKAAVVPKIEAYDQDTDDEIEEAKKHTQKTPKRQQQMKKENNVDPYEQDTDEEIEAVKKTTEAEQVDPKKDPYDVDTDIDEAEADEIEGAKHTQKTTKRKQQIKSENVDPYEQDTDEELEAVKAEHVLLPKLPEAEQVLLPKLPEHFDGLKFLLYGRLESLEVRKSIIRGIVAGGGQLKDFMGPEVDYVISSSDWDKNYDDALKVNPKVIFVRPTFIESCFKAETCLGSKKFAISK